MPDLIFDVGDWNATKEEPPVASPIDTGLNIEPGIHFGLSDDVYHALPALSASGIKNLLVSPMVFWAESFLNAGRKSMTVTLLNSARLTTRASARAGRHSISGTAFVSIKQTFPTLSTRFPL